MVVAILAEAYWLLEGGHAAARGGVSGVWAARDIEKKTEKQ